MIDGAMSKHGINMLSGAILLLLVLGAPVAAAEDVFVLKSGGRVFGELLNPDQSPRKTYVIKTAAGQVTLTAAQVKQRYPRPEAEIQYDKIRGDYPDTVQGHWDLAEWCREHKLTDQRETHLRRIIELDPDHKMARGLLGYQFFDGKWQTHDVLMTGRGLIRFEGNWLSAQEIRSIQQQREAKKAVLEWRKRLWQSSRWLGGPRTADAIKELQEVRDPAATSTLIDLLGKDRRYDAQRLYAAALQRIGTGYALKALAEQAVKDKDKEVRLLCLDELKKVKNPDLIAHFVGYLKSKDNKYVNRAAVALREMKDPSAMWPLIDALVTVHRYKVTSGNPGQTSVEFNSLGGGGLSTGSSTQIVDQPINNHAVLDALIYLADQTGSKVNFDFDVAAWKYWYASKHQKSLPNARRD
ncbi:MAG: HEAT repeat domain-containing protein [Pirellulales bacterium]|nr:HEAT repeat domain-containing protein [Pirellulales bacterium]